jgi:hypothetical protein
MTTRHVLIGMSFDVRLDSPGKAKKKNIFSITGTQRAELMFLNTGTKFHVLI